MLFTIGEVPRDSDGTIHHAVSEGDFVVKADQTVLAAPGDHLVGYWNRGGSRLGVFDANTCPACADAALGHGRWPTR
jgi:hypothetical protein